MSRRPDPKSRSGFVRAQPLSMSVAAVISKAKSQGIKIDPKLVYAVRTQMNRKKRKSAPSKASGGPSRRAGGGEIPIPLVVEIERIVERRVNAILKERLGKVFG